MSMETMSFDIPEEVELVSGSLVAERFCGRYLVDWRYMDFTYYRE